MGEVAKDTRLGRKVALKLLPAEFIEDSERSRRFTQDRISVRRFALGIVHYELATGHSSVQV